MDDALRRLSQAMDDLRRVEEERARSWALASILDASSGREAQMEAERGVEAAREALRRAKALVGSELGEKAWSGH